MFFRFGRMNADIFSFRHAFTSSRGVFVDGESGSAKQTRLHVSSVGVSGSRFISRSASSSTACFTSAFDGVGDFGFGDGFYENKNEVM
jgi:hypothetical protein